MTHARTILITGGSGGIGSAIARRCAAAGAVPVVGYCSRPELAQQVIEECGRGEAIHLDLSHSDWGLAGRCGRGFPSPTGQSSRHAPRAVTGQGDESLRDSRLRLGETRPRAALPAVDAVVHNAAIFSPSRGLLESGDEEIRHLIEINVLGPIRLTRALLDAGNQLRDVLFILSTASFGRGAGPYALSKIGELAVCKQLAVELAPRGVRVNAIVPGWTETPVAELAAAASGRSLDDVRRQHLDARILAPEEVGELCAQMLLNSPVDEGGHLVVWDRRESREPVWLRLETVFAADELAWTMAAAIDPTELARWSE